MSKTVMIPSNMNPWVCYINNNIYSYPAGTEQSVPDEVAALIESIKPAEQPAHIPMQSDWNQNKATATDYVKNRPFYTDGDTVVKIPAEYIPAMSEIILESSTASSAKEFKITVNDTGEITATEV